MSDTFKYLSATKSSDPANKFLQSKLGKSVADQDPYAYGEGTVPGGEGYDNQRIVTNQDEIDAWNKENSGSTGGNWDNIEGLGYGKTRYEQGTWGAGDMSIEDLRKKFNLSDDESAASGERQIYGYGADGTKVFIGSVTGDIGSLQGNSELISAHSRQAHPEEGNHEAGGESLSSEGDVKGAILNLWEGHKGSSGPEAEYEMPPIEHSARINQAKDRVKTYEQNVESGKTSEDIFGNSGMGRYDFDHTKGSDAIGQSSLSAATKSSQTASKSFLDQKVSDIKDRYKFKPVS